MARPQWLKWAGIGCASWIGLLLLVGLIGAIFDPPSATVPPTASDTVAARPSGADTVAMGVAAPALPVALPPHDTAPSPPVAVPSPPPATRQQKDITVYTTRTGGKYHRSGCPSLRRSREATTLREAKAMGYEPCRRCRPPQ